MLYAALAAIASFVYDEWLAAKRYWRENKPSEIALDFILWIGPLLVILALLWD